jgi:hypothetical protein
MNGRAEAEDLLGSLLDGDHEVHAIGSAASVP